MSINIKPTICIAGKNKIACDFLEWAVPEYSPNITFKVVCNRDDNGQHNWQPSLRFTAKNLGVEEVGLSKIYPINNLLFISLEFDRIVRPSKFSSDRLFNIHFSSLPKYRGIATSVWPLYFGDTRSGVTFHKIDAGIDTGEIVSQSNFDVPITWDARDLYHAYLEHGLRLVQDLFPRLLTQKVDSFPQPFQSATYFGRQAANYTEPPIDFIKTGWQVHNALRAFTFHEYQYPQHPTAGYILKSLITNDRSTKKPGAFEHDTRWTGSIATTDVDLKAVLSPYKDIYQWCALKKKKVDEIEEIVQLIGLDRPNASGWTPLAVASYHGNLTACQTLLEHGASLEGSGLQGTTPLMYAKAHFVNSSNDEIFQFLLRSGAKVNCRDVHGISLLEHIKKEKAAWPLLKYFA